MSHFLAAVIFTKYLIFRNKTSTEKSLCENRKFFRAVTFWASQFFCRVIDQNKGIYRRAPLIGAGTSVQYQFFQESYIFEKPNFLESYLFRAATFLKNVTFYSSKLFRRATFSQNTFSEEMLFHSNASSPQLRLLFISQ